MTLTLADLLAPVDRQQFEAEYRGRRPLHIRGHADKFADVMSWDDLSRLLSQSSLWSSKSLELVLDNRKIEASEYCLPGKDRDQRDSMLADIDKVASWLRRGASLVLNDIDALTPGLKAVATALEDGLGGKTQGNLYCSWQAHQGFPSHFDTHDVYAVHVAGRKTWRIYQRHFENPIAHPAFRSLGQEFHERHKGPVSMEVTLEPGDLLYLPRGWYHDAIALSEATIHVAFGVTQMIGLNILSALFEPAVQDPMFRANLPGPDDPGLEAWLAGLGDRLAAMLRDPAMLARTREALREFRYRRGTIRLPDDALERRYRRRHPRFKVTRTGGGWHLGDDVRSVPIPNGMAEPVAWAIDRDSFTEAEMAEAFPSAPTALRARIIADLEQMRVIERY